MATTDQLIPYELLIRYGDDGQPCGAHVQYRRVVTVDGEVVQNAPLLAQPLGLDDFPTSALMTSATADALARVTALEAAAQADADTIASLGEDLAEARGALEQANTLLAAEQAANGAALLRIRELEMQATVAAIEV